eukprot:m.42509 g.42509  ORF g.42509 m.42509 type:complete len:66 (+) comp33363_c0_seq2:168-365(+)
MNNTSTKTLRSVLHGSAVNFPPTGFPVYLAGVQLNDASGSNHWPRASQVVVVRNFLHGHCNDGTR